MAFVELCTWVGIGVEFYKLGQQSGLREEVYNRWKYNLVVWCVVWVGYSAYTIPIVQGVLQVHSTDIWVTGRFWDCAYLWMMSVLIYEWSRGDGER